LTAWRPVHRDTSDMLDAGNIQLCGAFVQAFRHAASPLRSQDRAHRAPTSTALGRSGQDARRPQSETNRLALPASRLRAKTRPEATAVLARRNLPASQVRCQIDLADPHLVSAILRGGGPDSRRHMPAGDLNFRPRRCAPGISRTGDRPASPAPPHCRSIRAVIWALLRCAIGCCLGSSRRRSESKAGPSACKIRRRQVRGESPPPVRRCAVTRYRAASQRSQKRGRQQGAG